MTSFCTLPEKNTVKTIEKGWMIWSQISPRPQTTRSQRGGYFFHGDDIVISARWNRVLVKRSEKKNPQKPGEGFISKRWLSFNQFEKYAQVKLDHFPKFRGASKKYLSWHHLGIHYFAPLKVIFNNTGTSSQRSVTTKIYTLRKNEEWKNNMFSGAMLVSGRVSRVVTPVK